MIRPRSELPLRTRVFQANRNGSDQAERVLGFNRKHLNGNISGCCSLSPQMQRKSTNEYPVHGTHSILLSVISSHK